MLIEEDRHAHILQHASGITVTIVLTDLKRNGELAGHRLHVGVSDENVQASPIIAALPPMPDDSIDLIISEIINEVTNIDLNALFDDLGEASEGP